MPEILCSHCGKRYKVKDEVLGKRVRCAGCKSEFEARSAPCRMELALYSPSKLRDAIGNGSLNELGFFLNHPFTLISVDDQGGYVPMVVDVETEGKKYQAVVLFTTQDAAMDFVGKHPDLLDETGAAPGFVMQGFEIVKHTPKKLGMLINPESPEPTILQAADWEPLRKAQQQFEKQPELKASIPQPHPEAGQISNTGDAAANLRNQSLAYLDYMGFQCARWLPQPDMSRQLRPINEIAGRLAALAGVFAWASAPPDAMPNDLIAKYFKQSSLGKYLTKEEAQIVSTSRRVAMEQHQERIGWRLENMWPLAWVLGFDTEPDVDGAQIPEEISMEIIFQFLDRLTINLDSLIQKSRVRALFEVIAKEDLFYCAHNAVRSAQLGESTVPSGFDPVGNGGVIHERRHALTWCLSPGVPWQDTDLST